MSINSLHIASSFLRASKLQVEITSRNLSGAQDPNYSRQASLVRNVGSAIYTVQGHTHGLGVLVEGFERSRDGLLDQSYRIHHREAEGARSVDVLADRLESVLGQGSGLTESFRDVRGSLLEVANRPDDTALRADLYQRLSNLTERFRDASSSLSELSEESGQRLEQSLARTNEVLAELGELNRRLPAFGKTSGRNALLDRRDALVDELSGMAEIRTVEQQGGGVAVYLEGRQLLYGDTAETLRLNSSDQIETSAGVVLDVDEGVIGNLFDFQASTVPGYQQELDALAQALVTDANAVHRNGYGLDGFAGRDLFVGTDATDIALGISDPNAIAGAAAALTSTDPIHSGAFSPDRPLVDGTTLTTTPTTSGSVDLNGTIVTWSDSESLGQILEKFELAGLNSTYDQATGKVILQREPTQPGPADISIVDIAGNLSQVLSIDTAISTPAVPGDGSVLRALENQLTEVTQVEDVSIGLETTSGSFRRIAQDTAERAEVLESDARSRRDSVSAVSTDEELLALQRFQQSFAAAARVANVADEILSNIINLGRN